jgi:hypothetical protein
MEAGVIDPESRGHIRGVGPGPYTHHRWGSFLDRMIALVYRAYLKKNKPPPLA